VNHGVKKPTLRGPAPGLDTDLDPAAVSAGWEVTSERVAKQPDGPWPCRPLDIIEAEMKDAPKRLQWAVYAAWPRPESGTPNTGIGLSPSGSALKC
jgi:hypothetical protein